jgi:hypothetical protein
MNAESLSNDDLVVFAAVVEGVGVFRSLDELLENTDPQRDHIEESRPR